MPLSCQCCKRELAVVDGRLERCARFDRGDFDLDDECGSAEDYIKCRIFICTKCYLEDADLCAFFNRIGMRVR